MSDYALRLPFDSDHAEFARGFEAGRLWERLEHGDGEPFEQQLHGSNAEMVTRMAERTGTPYEAEFDSDDGHWMTVRFGEREERV